jgi:four helix bundle protein
MLFYESLTVYQKAFAVNKEIYKFLKKNKSIPPYIKNQLGRASLSVMLNITEGTAETSSKDRRNFYVIARGSAFESASFIKFLASEKEIPEETAGIIYRSFEEISKMLFTMIKNLSKKQ